jgi:hypothetical protein
MDCLKLLDKNNFIYFSMKMTASRNKDTNAVKKIPNFPCGYKDIDKPIIFDKKHTLLAIRTGILSNIFVIDIDDLNNEIAKKLNNICMSYCKWKVSTRKGYHYYFQYDERLNVYEKQSKASNVNNCLGFDTRGNGGIIFFGEYNFENTTIKYELIDKEPKLIHMSEEIFEMVKLLLDPQEIISDIKVTKNKKFNIVKKYEGVIDRIEEDSMLKYIECLNDEHFMSYETWRDIFFICFNCNNSEKVIKALHKRSQIGKYSNVSLQECKKQFFSSGYIEKFNTNILKRICRKDNFNKKFTEYFNKNYDTPDFEFCEINEKYLKYDEVRKYFKDDKLCVLKSRYGSGKTTYIKKLIENEYSNKRVIFLVMRQSLAYDLEKDFKNLGFKNYMNKNEKIDYKDNKIIISIDSIEKITYLKMMEKYIKPYDLVICDEFCSLLSHFDFQGIKNVEEVFNIFSLIIERSHKCYFMDGDISNREIKYLQNFHNYSGKPLFNKNVNIPYNINLTYNEKNYFKQINEDLEAGRNICIVSMSSNFCTLINDKYGKKYKVLVYNQKSDDCVKSELKDIEKLFKAYNIVVYSPSITVGVSFDFDYFHSVYGFICNSVIARTFYQMLFRIRKFVNRNIMILVDRLVIMKDEPFISFYEIKDALYDDDYVLNSFEYVKLWNKWENDNNKNFLNVFSYYTEQKGFKFNLEKKPHIVSSVTSVEAVINAILESELITSSDFAELSNKVKKNEASTEDKYKIEKYIYFTKFNLDKDFNDYVKFKECYYKKLHILKGYLYNKFHDKKNMINEEKMIENIYENIKSKCKNEKEEKKNLKFKRFQNINDMINKIDNVYYANKFDKNIIEAKFKFFQDLQKIMKVKDGKVDKDILKDQKDELVKIFNDKKFKTVFDTRIIEKTTPKKLLGSLNTVYDAFGMEIKSKQDGNGKHRTEYLIVKKMDCIPESYVSYEKYLKKHINNDIEYMSDFVTLVERYKEKKITKEDFKDFFC